MADNVTELAQAARQLLMNTPYSPALAPSLERVREAAEALREDATPGQMRPGRVRPELLGRGLFRRRPVRLHPPGRH